MTNVLNREKKHFAAVALSKVAAIQSLLMPLAAESLLISKAQIHLREASILLALACYEKPEDLPKTLRLFDKS